MAATAVESSAQSYCTSRLPMAKSGIYFNCSFVSVVVFYWDLAIKLEALNSELFEIQPCNNVQFWPAYWNTVPKHICWFYWLLCWWFM